MRHGKKLRPGTRQTGVGKNDLAGIYDSFSAIAATIFAVPLNNITPVELWSNISSCSDDDDHDLGVGCSGMTPLSVTDVLVDGGRQYGLMIVGFFVVTQARWGHIALCNAVDTINLDLFGINCLEFILLTLLPYTYGAAMHYGDRDHGWLMFTALLLLLLLTKHGQILYLRTSNGKTLLIGHADADAAKSAGGKRVDDALNQRLLDPAASDTDDYAAVDGGSAILGLEAATPPVLHHLKLMRRSSLLKIAVVCVTSTLLYALRTGWLIVLLGGMWLFTEENIATSSIAYSERRLARSPSDADTIALRDAIATNKQWQAWQNSLPMPLERHICFRDCVYGFLMTAVILSVNPADSGSNGAPTLSAYIATSVPYFGAYIWVAVMMLSIYAMLHVTTEKLDAMSMGTGPCENPRVRAFLQVGLTIPTMMSIILPFLALVMNKLFLLGRYKDHWTVVVVMMCWYTLAVMLSLGVWVATVKHRGVFAPALERQDAAAVLVLCTAVLLTALITSVCLLIGFLLGSDSVAVGGTVIVMYMLPIFAKAIGWRFGELLIAPLWRQG